VAGYLVDTNVLLRFVRPDNVDYVIVQAAIERLWIAGDDLFYTSQNLAEFWNACTRPPDRNGYGLAVAEADQRARLVENQFNLLEGGTAAHFEWRRLVVKYGVLGVQVHDARLAATMRVKGIRYIVTFNERDFSRYDGIEPVSPATLASIP
jgi:predicted nucleic acid-binding protein